MRVIPIKMKNQSASTPAYVDDEDYGILSERRWSLSLKGYPRTGTTNRAFMPGKRQAWPQMHQVILWCPKGMEIDHIDGNPLNNQKSNLRVCTRSQNMMNRGKTKANTSGFKGVHFHKRSKKWTARIQKDGNRSHIGSFDKPEEAHEAYRESAKKLHGEFVRCV